MNRRHFFRRTLGALGAAIAAPFVKASEPSEPSNGYARGGFAPRPEFSFDRACPFEFKEYPCTSNTGSDNVSITLNVDAGEFGKAEFRRNAAEIREAVRHACGDSRS